MKPIIQAFLENGYVLSAKHNFQLFTKIEVNERKFIFNVDLLHPSETVKPGKIYVEHIDLGIPSSKYQSDTYKMKSIALPSSQILFINNFVRQFPLKNINDPADSTRIDIPLMGEIGTLITKSQSVLIPKRQRDALDIYLTIKQSENLELLCETILQLKSKFPDSYNTLYGVRDAFERSILLNNTAAFINVNKEEFDETVNFFFKKIGLFHKASH